VAAADRGYLRARRRCAAWCAPRRTASSVRRGSSPALTARSRRPTIVALTKVRASSPARSAGPRARDRRRAAAGGEQMIPPVQRGDEPGARRAGGGAGVAGEQPSWRAAPKGEAAIEGTAPKPRRAGYPHRRRQRLGGAGNRPRSGGVFPGFGYHISPCLSPASQLRRPATRASRRLARAHRPASRTGADSPPNAPRLRETLVGVDYPSTPSTTRRR